jgi:DNA-binding IclR family transcriptional regulator
LERYFDYKRDQSEFENLVQYLKRIRRQRVEKSLKSGCFTAGTLAQGLIVLEFTSLVGQKKGITIQEITKSLSMNRSKVYRYLKTLVDCGWLEYDPETRRYRIGGKPLQIAGASLQQMDLRTVARPFLENLAEETCLNVHLGVLNQISVIYIDKVESDSPIQMRSHPGMAVPAYCTAMGKAMLATLDPQQVTEQVAEALTQRTPNTIATIEDLHAELARVRDRGYAIDQEENEPGIGCIGAAIYGYDNDVIGAISLSTLIQNLTNENTLLLGRRLMKTASRISQSMGCHNNHWSIETERTFSWIRQGNVRPEKEVEI